jgi:hypothetical protein
LELKRHIGQGKLNPHSRFIRVTLENSSRLNRETSSSVPYLCFPLLSHPPISTSYFPIDSQLDIFTPVEQSITIRPNLIVSDR